MNDGLPPNIDDRLKASNLIDKVEGKVPIVVPNKRRIDKPLQKDGAENIVFVGTDVTSLFPSLRNVETARMAKYAKLNSNIAVENFDCKMALRYLSIVGGIELLERIGVGRLAPKWLGSRKDLITVGGKKSKDPKSWRDTNREIFKTDEKKIFAAVMEVMINVAMATHVYSFGGKVFLQADGGPIGLKLTAALAALIMKLWDIAWLKLLENQKVVIHDYYRYVDDSRNALPCLKEGWRWTHDRFEFSDDWEAEDLNSGVTDQHRTMVEITKAMSSLVSFLCFEGEESGMYPDQKLPTFDTAIW